VGGEEEEVAAQARVSPPWSPWRGRPEERTLDLFFISLKLYLTCINLTVYPTKSPYLD
jgi:hypothetical protein